MKASDRPNGLQILENEPMSRHTSFKIGGPARYFETTEDEESLKAAIRFAREKCLPYFILGNGSNLLVSDKGFDGVVIRLGGEFDLIRLSDSTSSEEDVHSDDNPGIPAQTEDIIETAGTSETDGQTIIAGAAVPLARLSSFATEHSLTGLEFASGIPGTLGGAIVMNAGAYGGEMAQVVTSAQIYFPEEDTVKTLSVEELHFAYRHSLLKETDGVVLYVSLRLHSGEKSVIVNTVSQLREQRMAKQPLEFPSAGSTFKRPEGAFAGKLIQDAGLRGFRIGDAQVSEKHCGFVINRGEASASDVYRLIREVQGKVKETSGYTLETEVLMLGEFE